MQVAMMVSRWEYSTRPFGNNLKMALFSFNVRTVPSLHTAEAGPGTAPDESVGGGDGVEVGLLPVVHCHS